MPAVCTLNVFLCRQYCAIQYHVYLGACLILVGNGSCDIPFGKVIFTIAHVLIDKTCFLGCTVAKVYLHK